jgi:hypothetical protein
LSAITEVRLRPRIASFSATPLPQKAGAPKRAQVSGGTKFTSNNVQQDKLNLRPNLQRPKPADCIDCRERSDVDAIPCIRSLNSSAFEALSRAVS